jgi:hypothetical protein
MTQTGCSGLCLLHCLLDPWRVIVFLLSSALYLIFGWRDCFFVFINFLSLLQNTWGNQLKKRKDLYYLLALEFSVHHHSTPLLGRCSTNELLHRPIVLLEFCLLFSLFKFFFMVVFVVSCVCAQYSRIHLISTTIVTSITGVRGVGQTCCCVLSLSKFHVVAPVSK